MSAKRHVAAAGVTCAIAAALLLLRQKGPGDDATVIGTVVDAFSGEPVAGARILADGRLAVLYRSSTFRLRLDSSVPHSLHVTAPGYADTRVVTGRGPVRIAVQGIDIPGLGGIIAWPRMERSHLVVDVQLRNASGGNIENFPRISLPAFIRLHENLGTPDNPVRGAKLYEGMAPESYDPSGKVTRLRYEVSVTATSARGSMYGILDFTLASPGGSFSTTRADVELSPEGRVKG